MYKSAESENRVAEARARGHITQRANRQKLVEEYNLNPKRCPCGNPIPYAKRHTGKFCSQSCSAKSSNKERIRNKIVYGHCTECGTAIFNRRNLYCSESCRIVARNKRIMLRLSSGQCGDESARQSFRRIAEKRCTICGNTFWNDKPIPLVVDHIDGNHNNNYITNLRMICCNCDAQLSTYKGRNKGHGRVLRKEKLQKKQAK